MNNGILKYDALCSSSVTLYHQYTREETADGRTGQVWHCLKIPFSGAFAELTPKNRIDRGGRQRDTDFLIVLPSGCGGRREWLPPEEFFLKAGYSSSQTRYFTLSPLDKIVIGEDAPEITSRQEWAALLSPVRSDIVTVTNVVPMRWKDAVVHVEVT